MIDLSTNYLGLKLKNPLVVSACPLCKDIDNLRKMEDSGASALVLHSLFEEQINIEANELDRFLWEASEVGPEAPNYYPDFQSYNLGPDGYLEHIRRAKQAVGIPVIASLNGVSKGGWVQYAREIEQAGADGLELNIYFLPTDPTLSAADVERLYIDLVDEVRWTVKLPLAIKISPYFSSIANMAQRLENAGANGLVLFNRFYQPDFDLHELEVVPTLELSRSSEMLLRLHWTAILSSVVKSDIAITGGVHTAEDVVKAMMAGARVTEIASVLLEKGIGQLKVLNNHLLDWLDKYEYESIQQMQGSMSLKNVPNPAAFQRSNYMKVLSSYAGK